jgi:hypothetical protein
VGGVGTVRHGLAAGEQVAYFDDGTADCVLERLADDGVEISESLRRGQFQVVPSAQTLAALLAPVDQFAGVLGDYIQGAVDAGWNGVRITGAASYGLRRPGGHVLDTYDAIVHETIVGKGARAVPL